MLLPMMFVLLPVVAFAQVKRSNPAPLSKPTGYTHVVEVPGPAKMVYIAGQIALDKDGKVVGEGDMKAQAEQVFKNLARVLAAAGLSLADAVKCNVYLTDIGDFQAMNAVYARQFEAPYPARTTVAVAALPGGARIEIELIARQPL